MTRRRARDRGDAGAYLGQGMSGGRIELFGSAGVYAAADMRGGTIHVDRQCRRFPGAALPGDAAGHGGRHRAGRRRRRRPGRRPDAPRLIAVRGRLGDFAACAHDRRHDRGAARAAAPIPASPCAAAPCCWASARQPARHLRRQRRPRAAVAAPARPRARAAGAGRSNCRAARPPLDRDARRSAARARSWSGPDPRSGVNGGLCTPIRAPHEERRRPGAPDSGSAEVTPLPASRRLSRWTGRCAGRASCWAAGSAARWSR